MTLLCLLFQVLAVEKLTYAAGYIPNVQFAPFYVASSRGYYAEEGLELKMDYTMGPEIFKLVALGKIQMGSVDSDAFLHAAVRKMPLVHVATLYQSYPISMIARKELFEAEKLRGKRIGISGTYGSSYLGLKVMLTEMGLGVSDVRVVPVGYTQVAALQKGAVDVVVGYLNNEPIRLKSLGLDVFTHSPGAGHRIPGVGLMTSRKFLQQHPDQVQAFLRATFRGLNDVITDPRGCYELVVENYLPQLSGSAHYEVEYQVLLATLPFWKSEFISKQGYGQCPSERWAVLSKYLQQDQGKSEYGNWQGFIDRTFTWRPSK